MCIRDRIITDTIIENYYNENTNTFIEPKNYTYEQIILENDRNESFVELKKSNNSQFKLFEEVNEKLILPQVLDNLKKLKVGDESESIKIGEKFFYVKLLSFKDEYQVNLKDAYEDIKNTLTQLELSLIHISEPTRPY